MGTRRSRHNKGRKPRYKEHRSASRDLLADKQRGEMAFVELPQPQAPAPRPTFSPKAASRAPVGPASFSLWEWSRIWKRREDFDYITDTKIINLLSGLGAPFADDGTLLELLARKSGHSVDQCRAAVDRLIWCGSLKRVLFDPPLLSTYRVTKIEPRRLPLNGKRFRRPRQYGAWGRPRGSFSVAKNSETVGGEYQSSVLIRNGIRTPLVMGADEATFSLDQFVATLNPKVARFCLALADGAELTAAADESGLSQAQIAKILPRLKSVLNELRTTQ
jgi:hypothetical protein